MILPNEIRKHAGIEEHNMIKKDYFILFSLICLAIITRSYGLSAWDFCVDEFFTVGKAAERYKHFINPAYYALVLINFKLFGINELSARLPAMFFGVLSIPVFYMTWRNVINRNSALIGSIFIICSSWHLWHSQYARFYSAVFLFGSISYFLYYKAIRSDRLTYLVWALIVNIVGISFHATSLLVPISCALFSIVILMNKQKTCKDFSRRIAGIHSSIILAVGLISMPFFLWLTNKWSALGQTWGYGPVGLFFQIIKYAQIPVAVCAFFGIVLMLKKDTFKGMFFVIGIAVPLAASMVGSAFMDIRPDYIFYVLPLVFALAGFCCNEVRMSLVNYKFASNIVIFLVITALLPEMVSHYTARKSLDFRDAIEFVQGEYQPGDSVASYIIGFDYYANFEYTKIDSFDYAYDNNVNWKKKLNAYKDVKGHVWIILPIRRHPLAKDLEAWLIKNATLMWRKSAVRYDYTVEGYQIFRVL